MHILTVQNLTKTFTSGWWPFTAKSSFTAVNSISFDVKKGEIVGFLGPNGAGKTTTIQMLLGTLTPTAGTITYFGKDFVKQRVDILRKIGFASGYDRLPARLTVWENLDLVGRIYGIAETRRSEQIKKLLTFFGIWQAKDKETGSLSAGQATRVMLCKAFIADPEIVLLDEPTASLDPDIAFEVRQFVLAQREERGISILVTSHNMEEVTELCDRVLVLKHGTIIADNAPETLARTISQVRVHVIVSEPAALIAYLEEKRYIYAVQNEQVSIEVAEQSIAVLLRDLAHRSILYSQISIDKPTLEDYFLSIAK